jgi:UDP-N-acetylmuramyl tripeptide synthase
MPINKCKSVMSKLYTNIYIDYAHTADALYIALVNLREKYSKICLIFGCGGDRDNTKRSKMGAIACEYADFIIITNDNPRNENSSTIHNQILSGMNIPPEQLLQSTMANLDALSNGYISSTGKIIEVISDRKLAIKQGIQILTQYDKLFTKIALRNNENEKKHTSVSTRDSFHSNFNIRESSLQDDNSICLLIAGKGHEHDSSVAALQTKESICLLIAGKGHESYQEIHGIRTSFNDKLIAAELCLALLKRE